MTDPGLPRSLPDPGPWIEEAACRGAGAAGFFLERGESSADAKAVCERCPVTEECLEYSQVNRIQHGVWGGRTEVERKRMRRGLAPRSPRNEGKGCGSVDIPDGRCPRCLGTSAVVPGDARHWICLDCALAWPGRVVR